MKIAVVTLGCDKNTVDSERYLADLADRGAEPTESPEHADVIVVNTCGFIDAAKKESIDAIIEAGRLKKRGSAQAVVAVGCMVERHRDELEEALPEVDLFLGASEMDRLVPELVERGFLDRAPAIHPGVRLFSGELPHVRYLKISEGCDHGCAFCAIPLMRGRHRSFSRDDVVREAQLLETQGAREINLVAQDLAHYGRDMRGSAASLSSLLEALVRETNIPWFRMLYIYSAGITPKLLELVVAEPRILPYFDMPMQHASDEVLKRMRRPERNRSIRDKVQHIRHVIPNVAIRTTCIVGFPGESDADFETLLTLLEEVQFDQVGAFAYSPQEGTAAGAMMDDVPEPVKLERLERLTELQRLITAERSERRVGQRVQAIVDRVHPDHLEARTIWQGYEIDGMTMLPTDVLRAASRVPRPGTILDVEVNTATEDGDLVASMIGVVVDPPRTTQHAARRVLPLASIGSYGR